MIGVRLLISDVDGTLVTSDKRLTERSRAAVASLHRSGIGFTVVSSRPSFGLRMLVAPLGLTLPLGACNGGVLATPALEPIAQRRIAVAVAGAAIDMLRGAGVDVWLFTARSWLVTDPGGAYVDRERLTVETAPEVVSRFDDALADAVKIVGVSADFARLSRCEEAARNALAGRATLARSQRYYLDVTAQGTDKGVAVRDIIGRLGVAPEQLVTIGDMENDVPMFAKAGFSIAMGNAEDAVKRAARTVTASNDEDGFAAAVERFVLPRAAS